MAIVLTAVASITYVSSSNYESKTNSGYSMSPNWWPEQVITGKVFDTPKRHAVYFTTVNHYRDWMLQNEPSIQHQFSDNDFNLKRLVGLPGDTLGFDPVHKTLRSINGVKVNLSPIPNTKRHFVEKVESRAMLFSMDNHTLYPVYEIETLPTQMDGATKDFLGKSLKTSYLDDHSVVDSVTKELTISLKEDEYYFLSDNRTVGIDSRHYGPLSREQIFFEIITPSNIDFIMKNDSKR